MAAPGRLRAVRLVALVLVALAGGAVGFLGYRMVQLRAARHQLAEATLARKLAGEAAASVQAPAPTPIPSKLPDFTMPDLAGSRTSLRQFAGHPLIVNFWASWCQPCRHEIPLLRKLRAEYKSEGLQVVGIAVDSRPAVARFLKTVPVDYPILVGEQSGTEAMDELGMEPVLPGSVFVDAHQHIIAVKVGELHADEAEYILATMKDLAAGQLTMLQARQRIAGQLRALAIARAQRPLPQG